MLGICTDTVLIKQRTRQLSHFFGYVDDTLARLDASDDQIEKIIRAFRSHAHASFTWEFSWSRAEAHFLDLQFDVVENARLALEAKDAQLQKMAARLAELERAKDEEQIGRARGEMREFQAQATDLEGEMKEAMRRLRGGGDAGSVEDDPIVKKSAPAAFGARPAKPSPRDLFLCFFDAMCCLKAASPLQSAPQTPHLK